MVHLLFDEAGGVFVSTASMMLGDQRNVNSILVRAQRPDFLAILSEEEGRSEGPAPGEGAGDLGDEVGGVDHEDLVVIEGDLDGVFDLFVDLLLLVAPDGSALD